MSSGIQVISLNGLALSFIPVFVVLFIMQQWGLNYKNALHALARMLLQLSVIGYFLTYLFETEYISIILLVLTIMLLASSWIALYSSRRNPKVLYLKSLAAIGLGGGSMLLLTCYWVLDLNPWYDPRYLIPLAGMMFSNAMNSVSLAIERLEAEIDKQISYPKARFIAFQAAMIPVTNSLFALGIVAIPGMMTGQILSGISPLIAARYQIMISCLLFGSVGIATACFLSWIRADFEPKINT